MQPPVCWCLQSPSLSQWKAAKPPPCVFKSPSLKHFFGRTASCTAVSLPFELQEAAEIENGFDGRLSKGTWKSSNPGMMSKSRSPKWLQELARRKRGPSTSRRDFEHCAEEESCKDWHTRPLCELAVTDCLTAKIVLAQPSLAISMHDIRSKKNSASENIWSFLSPGCSSHSDISPCLLG